MIFPPRLTFVFLFNWWNRFPIPPVSGGRLVVAFFFRTALWGPFPNPVKTHLQVTGLTMLPKKPGGAKWSFGVLTGEKPR